MREILACRVVTVMEAGVVVVEFYCVGGARACTRKAPWYVPCGEAARIVCR